MERINKQIKTLIYFQVTRQPAQPVQPVVQDDSNGLVKLPEEHQQRRIVVEEYPEYPSMQNQGKKYLIAV